MEKIKDFIVSIVNLQFVKFKQNIRNNNLFKTQFKIIKIKN